MKLTSSMAGKDPPSGDQGPLPASLLGWPSPTFLGFFPSQLHLLISPSLARTLLPRNPLALPVSGFSLIRDLSFPQDPSSSPQDLLHPLLSGPPRLPWSQVLAFAAAVAQDGFNVTHDLGQWGLGVGGKA